MKKGLIFFSLLTLFLSITVPVFAASNKFLKNAQKEYRNECNKKNVRGEDAILCFVFDKVFELEEKNKSQDEEISKLKEEIASIYELLTPTPTPLPESQTGFFTPETPINVEGYGRVSVTITGQQGAAGIFYSDDSVNWQLQGKFGEDFGDKSVYRYEIKGKYYKISSWANPSTSYEYTIDNVEINSPTADFTFFPQNPEVGQEMTFTNTSIAATQIKWEFGSPYTFYNTNSVVNLTPSQAGSFVVHLYVQNADGVVDTKSANITVGN